MRCVSCGADIPPEWVNAIETNICPGCGDSIMSEDARELMTELAGAISRMPNDPQGLAGWLMSNYRFKKIGKAEPTEKFHRPGALAPEQSDNQGGVKVANSAYDEWLERTQMANRVKATNANVSTNKSRSDKLAEMAASISGEQYGDGPDSKQDDEAFDEEDYRALEEMRREGIDPFKESPLTKNAGGALSLDQVKKIQRQNDDVDAGTDGIARANVGRNDSINDFSDEEKKLIAQTGEAGRKVVMESRLKRIKAQGALEAGGGSFSRS